MASIYSDEYQLVIKTLREARLVQGITQENLAQQLNRPQSFVAKFESGERRLDIVEFVHVAYLLSLDPTAVVKKLIKSYC
ncbi:helix-turn-helix transcriptional regulator [Salmonella enterica subsp. enterica]|uniref:helix-turn-helix domain-containing protein n=1 Tax=Salmonella enterica TaxID=28901 RepID=UPI00071ABA41|nr:helix-turn-helix transcriptional regulator [Salmonella enterica]EBG5321697.1 helix-turn-helix transcriptional regulator [Salmonella enterica subsp. enterica serovar Fresno]EBZ5775180.1 XRE family transcriptional regulator [Salmonella enterica subsp. enterica serovar Redlands]ECH9281667.1 XRE family transcriptional regulator [Salmonella enterica subsp. enterica]EEH2709096.1 helix-turn-helix transcriptional regulator [Salmonella enterica subsp. enterica serovar Lille]EDQ9987230.1 helix-turn-h